MSQAKRICLAVALACALPAAAQAASESEIERLRAEFERRLATLQTQYEARLQEMEARLARAEGRAAAAPPETQAATTAGRASEARFSDAFNPRISVILDGVYYHDNQRGKGMEKYAHIDGITHAHDHDGHGHAAIERGFNLRATEIAFSSTVSPYFDAHLQLAVDAHGGVELEQAYFDTRALPAGLRLRGGKFYSGIGYLNEKHPHEWDFVDPSLPYRTLLGEHGLNDVGLQLTWRPRTGSWHTLLGTEWLQGREHNFVSGSMELPHDVQDIGHGGLAAGKAGPRLITAFAKFGPDLGDSHALQFGLSHAYGRQLQEVHDHRAENPAASVHGLQGTGAMWGADLVYKFDAPGAYGAGDFTLAAEYLWQRKDLQVAYHQTNPAAVGAPRKFTQDGFYVQGVYGFAPNWQIGLRYDVTGLTNRVDRGTSVREWGQSDRYSLALTRHLTEYSRLRLQVSSAKLWEDGHKERVNQLFLQYQHSLGSHGAHKF